MVRARLASLALVGSLLLAAGCQTFGSSSSPSSGFSLFHRNPRTTAGCPVDCDCSDVGFSGGACCPAPSCPTGGCGAVPLISNAHPPISEGPAMFPPSPTPLTFPGATMPPIGAPRISPLPPVVNIPQAMPTPSPP